MTLEARKIVFDYWTKRSDGDTSLGDYAEDVFYDGPYGKEVQNAIVAAWHPLRPVPAMAGGSKTKTATSRPKTLTPRTKTATPRAKTLTPRTKTATPRTKTPASSKAVTSKTTSASKQKSTPVAKTATKARA